MGCEHSYGKEVGQPARVSWLRIAAIAAAFVAAVVAVRYAARDYLELPRAVALLQQLREQGWAIPAFFVGYFALTAAFVPGVPMYMVSGVVWGFKLAMVLNVLACNGMASAQFALARKLGRERVVKLLRGRMLGTLETVAAAHGLRAILLVRLLPLPTMAVNMGAGVSPVRWRDFALGTLLGSFPVIAIYTYVAVAIVEGVEGASRRAAVSLLVATALVVLVTLGPRLLARLRSNR